MRTRPAIVTAAFVLAAVPLCVPAQGFVPTKPVEFVTHTGVGAGGDVLARYIANVMEKEKLVPVRMHVVNKTGGGGQTAMAYLVEKRGDTHVISVYTGIWISNPLMLPEARTTMKDLTSLVRLLAEPGLIVVKSDSPFNTYNDFIEAAKRDPGALKQSGSLVGGRDWVLRQLLIKQTGANWAFIPFPVMADRLGALLGGHTNILLVDPQEAGEHIRAGTLRVIVQVADRRLPPYPDVPTLKEAGFDVPSMPLFRGVVAPPGIPREAVAYWEDVFARMVKTAAWRKYLEDNVLEDGFQRSADQSKFFDEYADAMRAIFRDGGIKVVR
jgi:putative tricarboxylic transport membrane protein